MPVIEGILQHRPDAFISIDTSKPEVANEALKNGCSMINDVTGAENKEMVDLIADAGAMICVMHMKGEPRTMQIDPGYDDVVSEVTRYLGERSECPFEAEIPPENILVDPGIGFGKRLEDNIALLKAGRKIVPTEGVRLLWGVSRKRMFLDLLGRKDSKDRLFGTLGVAASAVFSGVDVLRVHDVLEHADFLKTMTSTIGGWMMSDTVIDLDENVRVVGTAHVSRTSIDLVQEQISDFRPDVVAVELCESRLKSLENPTALDDEDLLSIIKDGRSGMILLQSALASQQRRMGIEHGEKPGAELLPAIDLAKRDGVAC